MNALLTERMITRARYIFVVMAYFLGVSSYNSGSEAAVYLAIFGTTSVYFALTIYTHISIRMGKLPLWLLITSVTVDGLLIFSIKFAFHFDVNHGYGMSIKEPATFLIYFIFGIMNALRYDKRLILYFGGLSVAGYGTLLGLAIFDGGMYFSTAPDVVFSNKGMRASHEIAKIIFLGGYTYFLYMMADFTNRNIKKIETARSEADGALATVNRLLDTVKGAAQDLSMGGHELTASTSNISATVDETNKLIKEITDISQVFSRGIGEIRKKINAQVTGIEQNYQRIINMGKLMEEVFSASTAERERATTALRLAEANEKTVRESARLITAMQDNSRKIEEISKTINDIAERTNLLSLNAAIESARAGEYGRGFAVVSDEISKLASISIDSSKEIATIIRQTVATIEEVSGMVEDMSQGLTTIIDFVKHTTSFVAELGEKTDRQYHESTVLSDANRSINKTTHEVIDHFNNQTELILRVLEWMEKMTEQTERVSESLNSLMILSHLLEDRSSDVNDMIEQAQK